MSPRRDGDGRTPRRDFLGHRRRLWRLGQRRLRRLQRGRRVLPRFGGNGVAFLDGTIVNVALPSIQRDLDFSQANLTWVVNAFLVTFGSLLLCPAPCAQAAPAPVERGVALAALGLGLQAERRAAGNGAVVLCVIGFVVVIGSPAGQGRAPAHGSGARCCGGTLSSRLYGL